MAAMAPGQIGEQRLLAQLKSTFGYTAFRPLQKEIVSTLLAGQDVFVLMPTGGGKSLCYQLPALVLDGLTVVVSPLIALMKDQVDSLRALGVPATYVNSSLDPSEIGRRQSAVARGEVKLLYVAPERLMQPGFLHLLSSVRLAYFAIDEAHCISEWGHDFRPEYRQLQRVRQILPGTALGAFTATATSRVEGDIKAQLGLREAASFRGNFDRANLVYDVRPKHKAYEQLLSYLRRLRKASGIIYCHRRAGTENLSTRLRSDGIAAVAYHAGLESQERKQRQEAFIRDDTPIIVATIAFGMGIDKPDVRFVVHYDLPKSLESYYQESGRAGRDGEPSDCILFYSPADAAKHRHFIDQKPLETERRIAHAQLQQMVNWAASNTCRRRSLLAYFGEQLGQERDPCCDVCRWPRHEEDFTIEAQMLLSCAKRTDERYGVGYLIDVLLGSRSERVRRNGHDQLSTFGIGHDRSKEQWTQLSYELVNREYVRLTDDGFSVLRITDRGNRVLFKGERVMLPIAEVPAAGPAAADATDDDLFEALRMLRKCLADERGIAPFMVFHDSTLRQMATQLPANENDFLRLQGVGQRKADDYGDAFLACIADYLRDRQTRSTAPSTPPAYRPRPSSASATVRRSVELFGQGQSVAEIAEHRGLTTNTIAGHLAEAIASGKPLAMDRLVAPGKRRAIEAAMAELGTALLKPLLDRLGEGYSYDELRLVRAMLAKDGT